MDQHVYGQASHGYEVAKRVCTAKQWMIRYGENVIGPVSLELLERGLVAGKIPVGAQMSFMGQGPWCQVADVFAAARTPSTPPPAMPRIIPEAPPSVEYPDPPVSIPMRGMMAAVFA